MGCEWDTDSGAPYANNPSTAGDYGAAPFTQSLTGLPSGTTIYARAFATNSAGTGYGTEINFLTKPAAPTALYFTGVTEITLRLNWTAPTGAASFKVERCTGASCTDFGQIASGVTDLFFDDSGLTAGTLYRYQVRATNATGDGAYSAIAETTTASANVLPVASAASIDAGATNVILTENAAKTVTCTATVTDDNGFADITSVEARLYETTQGAPGTADDNFRYILAGDAQCVPSDGADLTETYTCAFSVQFFADPAEWTCLVTPSDGGGAGTTSADTITVDALNALNVAASIDYGSLGLGSNSGASPIAVLVTNTGNTLMDPQVSSSADMTCEQYQSPTKNIQMRLLPIVPAERRFRE